MCISIRFKNILHTQKYFIQRLALTSPIIFLLSIVGYSNSRERDTCNLYEFEKRILYNFPCETFFRLRRRSCLAQASVAEKTNIEAGLPSEGEEHARLRVGRGETKVEGMKRVEESAVREKEK